MKYLIIALLIAASPAFASDKPKTVYLGDGRYACKNETCKKSDTAQMVRQNNDYQSAETKRRLEQEKRR